MSERRYVRKISKCYVVEEDSIFPDKLVKVLAGGVDNYDTETIGSVGYPAVNYDEEIDDKGNPVFVTEEDWVGIFTKEYTDEILMNGI